MALANVNLMSGRLRAYFEKYSPGITATLNDTLIAADSHYRNSTDGRGIFSKLGGLPIEIRRLISDYDHDCVAGVPGYSKMLLDELIDFIITLHEVYIRSSKTIQYCIPKSFEDRRVASALQFVIEFNEAIAPGDDNEMFDAIIVLPYDTTNETMFNELFGYVSDGPEPGDDPVPTSVLDMYGNGDISYMLKTTYPMALSSMFENQLAGLIVDGTIAYDHSGFTAFQTLYIKIYTEFLQNAYKYSLRYQIIADPLGQSQYNRSLFMLTGMLRQIMKGLNTFPGLAEGETVWHPALFYPIYDNLLNPINVTFAYSKLFTQQFVDPGFEYTEVPNLYFISLRRE